MLKVAKKRVSRFVTRKSRFLLPRAARDAAEMRSRGRIEKQRLDAADSVVISCGKSGRTWLRVMLSGFYQLRNGGGEPSDVIGFDRLHQRDARVPKLLFTHDTYLRYYTGHVDSKLDYFGHRVALLVRHPADVAVSRYFQWKHRMKARKIKLRNLPDRSEDLSIHDFVMDPRAGLPQIAEFMCAWAGAIPEIERAKVLRYEDLRSQPAAELGGLLDFLGTPGTPDEIRAAVEFGAFENMKQREASAAETRGGMRLRPGDRSIQDSYKVRRGKVGGYRDYFEDDEIESIDQFVAAKFPPVFGYGVND